MPLPITTFTTTMMQEDILGSFIDDPRKCPFCHTIRKEIPGSSYPYVTIKTTRFKLNKLYYIFPTPENLTAAILQMHDGLKPKLPLRVKLTNPISIQEKVTPTRLKKETFLVKLEKGVAAERQTKRMKGLAMLIPSIL